jgi:predicted AAA+ superfamily ATPase
MTRREQLGLGAAGLWTDLLDAPVNQWRDIVESQAAPAEDWRDLARRGGYPRPAVHLRDPRSRAEWFEGYLNTYLERDIPELSPIASLPDFRRVMQLTALRIGTLLNQTQLARECSVPQTTVQRYLSLLETSYQLVKIPAYAVSRGKRLIKTPKIYWSDTGLAMHLAGEHAPRGEHLENLVAHDLLAWRHSQIPTPQILYWRTTTGREVDFVIESERKLIPIEVKATSQPSSGDLASVRAFLDDYDGRAPGGLFLYGGEETFWIAKKVLAAPWWKVV